MRQLTKHFNQSEFMCHDGSEMPLDVLYNVLRAAEQLEVLRAVLGEPIYINSAYRSKAYNRSVGGKAKSQHVLGKAVDIHTKNHTPEQLYLIIDELIGSGKMREGGLGLYDNFIHYDIRGTKARWDYREK